MCYLSLRDKCMSIYNTLNKQQTQKIALINFHEKITFIKNFPGLFRD